MRVEREVLAGGRGAGPRTRRARLEAPRAEAVGAARRAPSGSGPGRSASGSCRGRRPRRRSGPASSSGSWSQPARIGRDVLAQETQPPTTRDDPDAPRRSLADSVGPTGRSGNGRDAARSPERGRGSGRAASRWRASRDGGGRPRPARSELVAVVDHRLELLGVPLDGQDDRPLLDAVGAGGDGGDDLPGVGQAEADGEGAVGPELDGLALERDLGVGLGRAVDDQLGVDLEVEAAARARAGRRCRGSGARGRASAGGAAPRRARGGRSSPTSRCEPPDWL